MKIFDKWDVSNFKVDYVALKSYINIDTIFVPRT